MTLSGYKFEFSPKFALSNFERIRQVAAQVRLLSQMCLVELLTHSLPGGAVALNLHQLGFLVIVSSDGSTATG